MSQLQTWSESCCAKCPGGLWSEQKRGLETRWLTQVRCFFKSAMVPKHQRKTKCRHAQVVSTSCFNQQLKHAEPWNVEETVSGLWHYDLFTRGNCIKHIKQLFFVSKSVKHRSNIFKIIRAHEITDHSAAPLAGRGGLQTA